MWLLLALVPAALYLALLFPDWRILPWLRHPSSDPKLARQRKRAAVAALGLGVLAALPVEFLVRGLASWLGVDPKSQITGEWTAILATLFLFAPLEEASKLVAVLPLRSRFLSCT